MSPITTALFLDSKQEHSGAGAERMVAPKPRHQKTGWTLFARLISAKVGIPPRIREVCLQGISLVGAEWSITGLKQPLT